MERIKVGVLGATGMVGQNYLRLLENHPWFEVAYVAASPNSAGKTYVDAVKGRWVMEAPMPNAVKNLIVGDANLVDLARGKCQMVFSAIEADKETIKKLEEEYAKADFPVVSNNSAHRFTPDVPMIIPEINWEHAKVIEAQRKSRGWKKGLLAVKPNCSLQSYATPLHALQQAGYQIDMVIISTMQAVSGAGFPGVASLLMIDNIIPYIGGEEEKSEQEPMKIFGRIADGKIVNSDSMKISAHCNRVPVLDGHTACVSVKFAGKAPSVKDVLNILNKYTSEPQRLKLPSAPVPPIVLREEQDRPQPHWDRDAGRGMAVTVGRVRPCNVFDIRFVALSHNTIRGAAGGAILMAELLKAQGYF